jgi:hypothetical protein
VGSGHADAAEDFGRQSEAALRILKSPVMQQNRRAAD